MNHLPVVGVMSAVLLLIWAMIRNNAELKRTALLTFVLVAIFAFLANYTGDGASHVVRDLPGVNRQDIRAHSSMADWATYLSWLVGAVALIGLINGWRKKDTGPADNAIQNYVRHHKEPHNAFIIACLLLGLFEVVLLAWTAELGGAIRHPEIRSGFVVSANPSPAGQDTSEGSD
ncbi:MAG TPA: hypothetical protein VG537_08480 [Candidatus Kapabacteria bacterium]|nr:hypothetical protein [Candidatus Kapabacteria bacterium]